MENYIVLNGKRTELTEEQLKELGLIMEKKSPFDRVDYGKSYYSIRVTGEVQMATEVNEDLNYKSYKIANYCTDREMLQQQAYRENLNRLLWRYSMEHDGDKIDWNDNNQSKYYINYSHSSERFYTNWHSISRNYAIVYFRTEEIAENAIKEIVEPFMKKHPDFR